MGFVPSELNAHLRAHGYPAQLAEVRRLLAHVIAGGGSDLRPSKPVHRSLLEAVRELTVRQSLDVVERVADGDGFTRYLLRSPDGALSEAVRIPMHQPDRYTLCLSTQVGCAMGCRFCATGRLGLTRHLQAWEMVATFVKVRDESGGRVRGVGFMGQGEPFHNYDQVLQAARVLSHPCGGRVRGPAISISTVGLVPQIRRFTQEGHRFRLFVSLNSAIEQRRKQLCPTAAQYPLAELALALREHARVSRRPVGIAWVLLGGVNTGKDEVAALAEHFGDLPLRLSLINLNDGAATGFVPPSADEVSRFMDELQSLSIPMVRRHSGGATAVAGCGMLHNARTCRLDRLNDRAGFGDSRPHRT